MSLEHLCRAFLRQTVVRQGSSVFCVSKSSEAERERMEPQERNERVCGEEPDTDAHLSEKSVLIYLHNPHLLHLLFFPLSV
jgi:hypothetical protein